METFCRFLSRLSQSKSRAGMTQNSTRCTVEPLNRLLQNAR
jgi:hypothetical protein